MQPYKMKHVPTSLYYQPHKHRGSNLSKRGKIYQTGTHGLSEAFKRKDKTFRVYVHEGTIIHKLLKDMYAFNQCSYNSKQLYTDTLTKDWVKEELKYGL
jgi:hypothetical protein